MSNYPGPPSWAANTQYVQNQSEVVNANFYYVCATSGTSGNSNPFTANAAASVFNNPVTDGTCVWVAVQRSRTAWIAAKAYTSGPPVIATGASVSSATSIISQVRAAQFVAIGSYVVDAPTRTVAGATVIAVNAAGSVVTMSANGTSNTNGTTVNFAQAPYPWPDQIVTGSTGTSPVVQCIISGTSGGSQPTWPANLGASVTDGSAAWATVGFN